MSDQKYFWGKSEVDRGAEAAGWSAGWSKLSPGHRIAIVISGLILLRIIAAIYTPLFCDEAYYWMWSKNLAFGYYDHPPMVALVVRLGTMIAGDTQLGVRIFSILLAVPMSWAVYRSAAILFGSLRVAATAAFLLNITMMASVGTMVVTPDAPLMLASSFILLFLAKVYETGRGTWWLAVGAATGVALLSKYNALFFGVVILIWLASAPELRRWLASPWPYLGALVALAMFLPVLFWNADHDWVSFGKQFGRARFDQFQPKFLATLLPGQILFATPTVFFLGASGLYALIRGYAGTRAVSVLINATVGVVLFYFAVHALHAEVHPDWLSPIYPALAVAAAVGIDLVAWNARWQRFANFLFRWAAPGHVAMFALLLFQIDSGVLTGYRNDPAVHVVAVGFADVAKQIDAVREKIGAKCLLASDYGTTAWLVFYLPKGTCVAQLDERIRWVGFPEPDPALLQGRLLYVVTDVTPDTSRLLASFTTVETIAKLARMRGPTAVQTYELVMLDGPIGVYSITRNRSDAVVASIQRTLR